MANTIKIKRSLTAGVVPASLAEGELFINQKDRVLAYPDETGTVRTFDLKMIGGGSAPNWHNKIYGAYGDCNPSSLLEVAISSGTVAVTPTNLGTAIARCALFDVPANLVLNKIRFYGVGATSGIFQVAIYDYTTKTRLTGQIAITTAANAFGSVAAGGITLEAGKTYMIAVSANATGTVAGMLCMTPTQAATTGQIAVLPDNYPGNLKGSLPYLSGGFLQFAVTNGALPTTAPALVAQTAWTGGFPAFWLDNDNT